MLSFKDRNKKGVYSMIYHIEDVSYFKIRKQTLIGLILKLREDQPPFHFTEHSQGKTGTLA